MLEAVILDGILSLWSDELREDKGLQGSNIENDVSEMYSFHAIKYFFIMTVDFLTRRTLKNTRSQE